jgi:hypothetical protein
VMGVHFSVHLVHSCQQVDLGRQILRLADEEISLCSPCAGPRPSSVVVAKDELMPAKCEGIRMARSDMPLEVESSLVEQKLQAHPPAGIYIARTSDRGRREVPLRALNATYRDQKLTRGSVLTHREPVALVSPLQCDKSRNDTIRRGASRSP